jgi:transcriptional regulator with XRE-family HTH domain
MKTQTVKTYMNQLVKSLGSNEAVADYLGISKRYVIYLKKGERVPSDPLRKLIKLLLK